MTGDEHQQATDDLMALISAAVYDGNLDGPTAGEVLAEVIADRARLGAVLGAAVRVVALAAAQHPKGGPAGLADVRAILDSGVGR